MKIYAYNQGSQSAKELSKALGIQRIRHEGPEIHVDTLINWGSSHIKRRVFCDNIINPEHAVGLAANKLKTFKALDGKCNIPDWTEDPNVARQWIERGDSVVIRHKLSGHSGQGIAIVDSHEAFNAEKVAPLYTKYKDKKEEYRIHVFRGKAFFFQRKARKLDVPEEEVNWKVRNLKGGFIYANKNIEVPEIAQQHAIRAVAALHLDFGAVDLMLGRDGHYYVLEVNTACGLMGTTLTKYVEQFKAI